MYYVLSKFNSVNHINENHWYLREYTHTSFSIFLSIVPLSFMQYLIAASILVTLFNFTDLQMETTLVENAVEKFNLQWHKIILLQIMKS